MADENVVHEHCDWPNCACWCGAGAGRKPHPGGGHHQHWGPNTLNGAGDGYPTRDGRKFRCSSCGITWDEDDLAQVQPDGRNACPTERCGVDTLEDPDEYEARQAAATREAANLAAQERLL